MSDLATAFTLEYLDIIERELPISWDNLGRPICVFDDVKFDHVSSLKEALHHLMVSDAEKSAREAAASFGATNVQTVGFGHVSDFDRFVKLGFLYGSRNVIFDVINSRILIDNASVTPEKVSVLVEVACGLLLLKKVVERGGLIILAHPLQWSKKAGEIYNDLHAQGNLSSEIHGLAMALTAIDEGIPLHPYTLSGAIQQPRTVIKEFSNLSSAFYSPENFLYHHAISSIFSSPELVWLEGASADDFHRIAKKHQGLENKMRDYLCRDLIGLSPIQVREGLAGKVTELQEMFDKRNKDIRNYVVESGTATLALGASTAAALVNYPVISLIAASAAVPHLINSVRKWLSPPPKNLLLQVFWELGAVAQEIPALGQRAILPPAHATPRIQTHIDTIMNMYWTEERHHYLETLDIETAKLVLEYLDENSRQIIVNHRKFQEDYIGDYLSYIWTISEGAFWDHMVTMFDNHEDGILLSDLMEHIEILENNDMPIEVWHSMLRSIFWAHGGVGMEIEFLHKAFVYQTTASENVNAKIEETIKWVSELSLEERGKAYEFIGRAFGGRLPDWIPADPDGNGARRP